MLTNLLLDDLKQTAADGGDARVIVVTSSFHDPDTVSTKKNGNWNLHRFYSYKQVGNECGKKNCITSMYCTGTERKKKG